MLVLTQRLTRLRLFNAWPESTASCGGDGLILHSELCLTQNSTQPLGARVVWPAEMNSERSAAVLAVRPPSKACVMMLAAAPRLRISFLLELTMLTRTHK